ncbi:hypothetical protein BCD_0994 (plasmid) [Borrelia crocidurae DOU]|uniref:Uncharacterized protein n=1 Tax=Borrelia crocidurae DOU TaxID=1293575 RepID=W5SJF8_9SPIR|nr:hypothetical protein BCD_0964 [Borrelia crocidurae DOU]AHH07060.1 hypothetical protein BCD_0994 [Borrelia crocidurae DOU]
MLNNIVQTKAIYQKNLTFGVGYISHLKKLNDN